jgi:hypothetical protein
MSSPTNLIPCVSVLDGSMTTIAADEFDEAEEMRTGAFKVRG